MSVGTSPLQMPLESEGRAPSPFETAGTAELNERRREFLDRFLPLLIRSSGLRAALDVGCGFGYFSQYLTRLGLKVTALDVREENVLEARGRNPGIAITVRNIEDPSISELGSFDLSLCFGLLYHLENPIVAIRNLAKLTEKFLVLETRVAPYRSGAALLYQEGFGPDQGVNYIALVPSEKAFIKILYRAGFPFVYRPTCLPDHPEFRGSVVRKRMRTILVATKIRLDNPPLKFVPEPIQTNRYRWYRLGLGHIFECLRPLLNRPKP